MKDQFEQWSQDASSIFNAELASLFEQQQPHCVSFIADIQVDQATKHQVINTFQSLSTELVTVVNHQLNDILPHGCYMPSHKQIQQ